MGNGEWAMGNGQLYIATHKYLVLNNFQFTAK